MKFIELLEAVILQQSPELRMRESTNHNFLTRKNTDQKRDDNLEIQNRRKYCQPPTCKIATEN